MDHDYCRISDRLYGCPSGLGVSSLPGIDRVEPEHHNIQESLQEVRSAQHRSFCLSSDKTNGFLRFLKTRPILQGSRCSPTKMNPYFPICVSTVFPGGENNKECGSGQNQNNIDYTNMAIPTIVPDTHKESSPSPKLTKSAKKSRERVSSIDKNKETKIGSMASFAQQIVAKAISKRGSELVINSKRTGTQSTYESACNRWASSCHQLQVDSF